MELLSVDDIILDLYKGYLSTPLSGIPSGKVNLHHDLHSPKERYGRLYAKMFSALISHLYANALEAFAGKRPYGMGLDVLLERWSPEKPGTIHYRTKEDDGFVVFEFEDDGCGISPDDLLVALQKRHLPTPSPQTPYVLVNAVFGQRTSTRANVCYGGNGLVLAQHEVAFLSGRLFVRGTTYQGDDGLVTVGKHHGRHTGTIIAAEIPHPNSNSRYP